MVSENLRTRRRSKAGDSWYLDETYIRVSGHAQWHLFSTVEQSAQETTCCMFVPVLAEHRIEKVSISIDRTVQVTPAATDLDVRFIQVPGDPCCAAALRAKILADHRCKAELPGPDGLVADLEPALLEQLCHIAEAELVPQTPEHSE